MNSIRIFSLSFLLFLGISSDLFAQCPSVTGTGDPAVILLNIYGIPHGNYFAGENEGLEINTTAGIQIGAILSDKFNLVSGAEFSWTNRTFNRTATVGSVQNYKTFFLEIPLDMRMRLHHSRQDEVHFILGAGAMLYRVNETNDPETTRDELFFHQLFGRIGFEHTIQVKKTFNILWGLIGKVDPIGLINEDYSALNGTYYGGLKLGIQLGL